MTEQAKKYLSAEVDVPATESLEEIARRLGELMPGFNFEEESTGRYEEVPAFIAGNDEMCFVLFGIPEGEYSGAYKLQFDCATESVKTLLESDCGELIRQFVSDKPSEDGFFFDFSKELAQLLVRKGLIGCEPILPLD